MGQRRGHSKRSVHKLSNCSTASQQAPAPSLASCAGLHGPGTGRNARHTARGRNVVVQPSCLKSFVNRVKWKPCAGNGSRTACYHFATQLRGTEQNGAALVGVALVRFPVFCRGRRHLAGWSGTPFSELQNRCSTAELSRRRLEAGRAGMCRGCLPVRAAISDLVGKCQNQRGAFRRHETGGPKGRLKPFNPMEGGLTGRDAAGRLRP